jgi:hypothetical protein
LASAGFDNGRNLIFEENHMTGVSLVAMGSNIDTLVATTRLSCLQPCILQLVQSQAQPD